MPRPLYPAERAPNERTRYPHADVEREQDADDDRPAVLTEVGVVGATEDDDRCRGPEAKPEYQANDHDPGVWNLRQRSDQHCGDEHAGADQQNNSTFVHVSVIPVPAAERTDGIRRDAYKARQFCQVAQINRAEPRYPSRLCPEHDPGSAAHRDKQRERVAADRTQAVMERHR